MELKGIILAFILVLVGVALVVVVADTISIQTNSIAITNETLTVNNLINETDVNTSRIFNLTNAPWESGSVLIQMSNGTPLTSGTDFDVDYTRASINFSNTSAVYRMANEVVNETLDISAAVNATDVNTTMLFNLTNNIWLIDTVLMQNSSGNPLTSGTDFSVDYTIEAINFSNTSATWTIIENSSNNSGVNYSYFNDRPGINYSYFDTNFIDDGASRNLVGLIVLFLIIGLFLAIIKVTIGFDKVREMLQ